MQRLGLLVGLGISGSAWAAETDVEVTGSVIDEDTGLPVADAGVVVVFGDTTLQTVTAEDGSFVFDLPEGPASLEVISVEHQPLTASFVVAAGIAPLDLVLRPGDLEELTVLYYKEQDPVVTRRSVTAEEVVRVPGAFGDPVRVVTSLPGAARPPFGSSQLIIRGGNDDDTTVFIDGVEVPVVYHVGGYRSVVHPSMVAEVDFLPGIFPSRYGDTTSGVVDIQTRADWGEDWEITTQADLLDASASFRGTIADKVGVAGAIRRSYIDAVLIGLQNDFILPRWFDYQVQVQSLNTSPHTLRLIVFGLQDRLGVDGSDFGITNETTSHRGVGSWVYEPNGRFKFLTQGTVGWDDDQIGLGTDISLVERGLRLGLRSEGRWTPDSRVVVVAGGQVQSSNLEIEATLPFDPDSGNADAAFEATEERWVTQPDPYLELQYRPSERFLVNAGVRGETMLREGLDPEFGVSPRVSLRGKLGRSATLKGGAGIVHQMPSTTALAFSPDTQLALERAYTAEVGWEQAFGKVATLDTVVYGRLMDRIATQQFGVAAFDNSGIGRAYGLEVLLRKEPTGPLFGWISYSLSRSERIDDPDETDEWTLFGLDQTHNLIAVGGYELPKRWDLGLRFQYTSGNPFTPYEGGVFELSDGTYTGIASGAVNSERLAPYIALDLRVSKTWEWRRGEARISLDLLNVIRGENPEFVVDAYDFSESESVSGLPFLPSPGFQIDWRF